MQLQLLPDYLDGRRRSYRRQPAPVLASRLDAIRTVQRDSYSDYGAAVRRNVTKAGVQKSQR
jgi:hypothetical protein